MTIPDYQSLLLPVLKCSEGGEVRLNQVVKSLANQLKLSEEERVELLPSGQQTVFANRVGWAKTYLTLLISMGYGGSTSEAGKTLGGSGDDGVDGVINQDPLGLDRVYVQAKRYGLSKRISSGAIRDFFGSLDRHKASKGLFVTTSTFSDSARETADFLSKRIVLIDGKQLAKLMIRYNVGCRIEETLYLKKVDEEFFE
jgi:restriction system protein